MTGNVVGSAHPFPPNRAYDGTANNPDHPRWGSVGEQFIRLTSNAYADGVSRPSGSDRPNARTISNKVCRQTESVPDRRGLSDLVSVWGLFLIHGFQSFRAAEPEEQLGIVVPPDDDVFEPGTIIPLSRAAYDISTGRAPSNLRRQLVNTTSYLDAALVYGIDFSRAGALRTFVNGAMKTSEGNLLPLNTFGLPNRVPGANFFLAGDDRANTSFALCALHTLFVREHNRLAGEIASANPDLNDEEVFQRARRFVDAQIQAITYNEFLPALLGPNAPSGSVAYEPRVNATISEVFSVVGFRFGHSVLSPRLVLLYDNGEVRLIPQRNSFFNVEVIKRDGLDPIFRGLASQVMQKTDPRVTDDIRNQTIRFNVRIDLMAYDIQSAREFGIPDYNRVRQDMDLLPVRSFADITSDPLLQRDLRTVYRDVGRVDPLIGGLAEDHLPESSLGALFTAIIVEQFERLRSGDRFWYENDPALSREEVANLRKTTLADLIRRNTGVRDIQDDVFFAVEVEPFAVSVEPPQRVEPELAGKPFE
jgi:peroxidase